MTTSCPICNADSPLLFRARDYNRKITSEPFNYFRCKSCGLIYLSPTPKDLGKYYPHDYYSIPSSLNELSRIADAEHYKIDIVKQFSIRGKLLEIGPAYGSFLYLAKQSGFNAEAIEMEPNCCKFISETIGIKMIQSNDPIEALKNNIEKYDIVALWHVIEHLPNPWKTLEAISRSLKSGGILVIAAPNPEALQFRVLRRFWPHVDAPRHLSLIPLALLTREMLPMDLKPVWSTTRDKGTLGWNTFGWMYFFMNFTNLRYMKTGLAVLGRMISFFLSPIERISGLGSAYTVVYQKEK